MDRELAPGEADYGAPPDDEWLQGITVIGFSDDAVAGADDAASSSADDRADAAGQPSRRQTLQHRLGDALLLAAAVARGLCVTALLRLRDWFLQTQLRARRGRAVLMVLIAVALSLGAGIVMHRWLGPPQVKPLEASAPPIALPEPTVSVLVARDAIPRGHILNAKDITWQPWPTDRVKPSFIVLGARQASAFSGYVACTPLAPGEPLSESKIAAPGGRGFLSALLRPGMRAVSVMIGPQTAAGGLIIPGDYIDVMLTLPIPAYDPDGKVAAHERASVQTLLRNIRVLAIDQMVDSQPGRAIVGQTATLEVTPKEAEIIALADAIAFRSGMLTLTLRSLIPDADSELLAAGGGGRRGYMLDTDLSKLLTDRPVELREQSLTIVRGGRMTEAQLAPRF